VKAIKSESKIKTALKVEETLVSVRAQCNGIAPSKMRASYVSPYGEHGVKNIILEAMEKAGAILPGNASRELKVSFGLLAEDIISYVRAVVGPHKYTGTGKDKDKPVRDVLRNILVNKDKTVGTVQLTSDEDCFRKCKRPRKRYYKIV
jgi:hypothetical protein